MNKAFRSHFRHFGRLLGKIICSSLPARLMEGFPAGKVHPQPNLLGSVLLDVCPHITGQFGVVIG